MRIDKCEEALQLEINLRQATGSNARFVVIRKKPDLLAAEVGGPDESRLV